jgi:hypothetical protein
MTRIERALTKAAGTVIVVLTAAAFWLSYAHLHAVASGHGLGGSPARAWAWPGCLDLFVVAGELLMLRASLARRTDWWAVGLVVVGSGGSIALNVLGVDGSDPLAYVTAAVPPTAALLAFGALMRQVHTLLSGRAVEQPNAPETAPVFAPVSVEQSPVFAPVETTVPAVAEPQVTEANAPEQAESEGEQAEASEQAGRLTPEQARQVIEQCWTDGLGIRETARRSTRSPSTVAAAFKRLETAKGPQPSPGQLALVK